MHRQFDRTKRVGKIRQLSWWGWTQDWDRSKRLLAKAHNWRTWQQQKQLDGITTPKSPPRSGERVEWLYLRWAQCPFCQCFRLLRGDIVDDINTAGENSFAFKLVNLADFHAAIKHFSSQAGGEDGVPQRGVAKALPVIGDRLVGLFNASSAPGVFLTSWKMANILALKKATVPSVPFEFRSIALLCFLSKELEKLAHDQFVITFHLLFDFSKAFDTIPPSKLLVKLRRMGFRGELSWSNHTYRIDPNKSPLDPIKLNT